MVNPSPPSAGDWMRLRFLGIADGRRRSLMVEEQPGECAARLLHLRRPCGTSTLVALRDRGKRAPLNRDRLGVHGRATRG